MKPGYAADIGLEVHAELQTQSKMFCACPVVDLTQTSPNTAVCPICAGMPGTLPVVNEQAVAMALKVALALDCEINPISQFARKNYFYPDLPKGYQISQYEHPLAEQGILPVRMEEGFLSIRIRRVHLEEDTAKLTHFHPAEEEPFSLVDLNRSGIPLLEIVSEPDMHTIEQVLAYTRALRTLLQYLEVNSGDLEKGVIRFEANVSVRPAKSNRLGTRVEIKNLNSFHAMTSAIAYELDRQTNLLDSGERILQETLGWDEIQQLTVSQRSKEEAHDYRYFPEPDLPLLKLSEAQIASARQALPERPDRRFQRFVADLELEPYPAELLTGEKAVADFYEAVLTEMPQPDPALAANWILGELFSLMHTAGKRIDQTLVTPQKFAALLAFLGQDMINPATAKRVLIRVFESGEAPLKIIEKEGLGQISDHASLKMLIQKVMDEHQPELIAYREGKGVLFEWFFGQVMRISGGKANPAVLRELLNKML